jgi:molybdopterin biosynthesis enzyme
LRKVKVEDAVGLILAHDVTRIVPGEVKEVAFKRGRVIRKDDIEGFLDIGKAYVYVVEDGVEGLVHEEEAAFRMAKATATDDMEMLPAKEGRVTLKSRIDGLLSVNRSLLARMNQVKDVLFNTLPDKYPVRAGNEIAATRIIPLSIREETLQVAEEIAQKGIIRIDPYRHMKGALVVTGSEVYSGRVADGSSRVEERLTRHGLDLIGKTLVPDSVEQIREVIIGYIRKGAEIVITTGGLSVDPDDITKEAIEATGARIMTYGAPLFPGAMFLIARLGKRYIIGAPACVYYSSQTALDVLLPWILAERKITANDIRKLAYGGLCLHCPECHYPNCVFGKGR